MPIFPFRPRRQQHKMHAVLRPRIPGPKTKQPEPRRIRQSMRLSTRRDTYIFEPHGRSDWIQQ